jgi:hypothetical protein
MTQFDFDSMSFYETLQNGFFLPLIPAFIAALVVSRIAFRWFMVNFVLSGGYNKSNINFSDSIFYVLGIVVGLSYGEYITYKENWRWVDHDNCFRGYPHNQVMIIFKYFSSLFFFSLVFF